MAATEANGFMIWIDYFVIIGWIVGSRKGLVPVL
jgi:hypothetical protein